jgi:methylated-DNA-[protein]-cysteine S-methyltransferase
MKANAEATTVPTGRTKPSFYILLPSSFGTVGVVWSEVERGPTVQQLFLPGEQSVVEGAIQTEFPGSHLRSCPAITQLGEQIQAFLKGEHVRFDLELIALDRCSEFQRKALLAEYEIPRGWVSTYGRIASKLGIPGGGRAVGRALARNPFPIVIPCHRAVQSNGELGGFQGGVEMKRALLELEGVEFTSRAGVLMRRVY